MALTTTTIGSYPKPAYVAIPDMFQDRVETMKNPTRGYAEAVRALGADAEAVLAQGTREAVRALGADAEAVLAQGTREAVLDQVGAGVDIPTDGEIRRENYIHYHCRHIDGIDFDDLTLTRVRDGAYADALFPTITGPVGAGAPFLARDWKLAQSFTERPVKITVPGPMTIGETIADAHYGDPRRRDAALAEAVNVEIRALAEAGCRHVQVDEPLFARRPEDALACGFENLERCFHGLPEDVIRTVHMCCGYPDMLDNPDFVKAPKDSYARIADAIEDSVIQAVSIEDAHRPNDLSLLERFRTTTVILGVVAIASSRVETVEEIRARLAEAREHIDARRLIAAPDCGLAMLGRDLALEKLANLCRAAHDPGGGAET